jgi:hypothetical protein
MSDIYAGHQALFDHVVGSLITQGKPSLCETFVNGRRDLGCVYRGDGGTKCAAGWAIPDEDYAITMEGLNIDGVIKSRPAALAMLKPYCAILGALQDAHDHAWAPDMDDAIWLANFKRRAAGVCQEFRLEWRHG